MGELTLLPVSAPKKFRDHLCPWFVDVATVVGGAPASAAIVRCI
jgi:hypothetical protein